MKNAAEAAVAMALALVVVALLWPIMFVVCRRYRTPAHEIDACEQWW